MAASLPRVLIVGATGRTGNPIAHGLANSERVQLVGCVAPSVATNPTHSLPMLVSAYSDLSLFEGDCDAVVDFTSAEVAESTLEWCLSRGAACVVGTTGFAEGVLEAFGERFAQQDLGLLYAPNFSLGAVLMMQVSAQLASYFDSVEVIETHRLDKVDAPSGTAIRTAQLIAQARGKMLISDDSTTRARARGTTVDGIAVHSLRMAGAEAHQEVVFSGEGQFLTIRHDAISRDCYLSGVELAIEHIGGLRGLVVGLETLL